MEEYSLAPIVPRLPSVLTVRFSFRLENVNIVQAIFVVFVSVGRGEELMTFVNESLNLVLIPLSTILP